VGIPLLLPALLSGGSLVFLYSFTSFGVPLLLGGPRWGTLEVETYTALAYRLAFPEATALVLMQLGVSVPVLLFYLRLQERYALGIGAYGEPKPVSASRAWTLTGVLTVIFLLIYSPLLSLLVRAFQRPEAWISVWRSQDFTPAGLALGHTLVFASLSLLVVIPLAGVYAYAVWRGHRLLDGLGLLPLLISPVAVGLGYLLAYPGLRGSLLMLITAYALLSYPLLARALLPSLRAMPKGVVEGARVLGATPWRRFWRVEWPLVQPGFRAGLALSLAAIVGEFGATLVLQRPEWTTLSLAIYERLGRPGQEPLVEALVLAVLLAGLVGGLVGLMGGRGRS
jgi:thiamine transport system permease protein